MNRFPKPKSSLAILIFVGCASTSHAQSALDSSYLVPTSPTSADVVRLSLPNVTCGNLYIGNPYRVAMTQNSIVVTLGSASFVGPATCPTSPREFIDLGKLPAGAYSVTVNRLPAQGTTLVPVYSAYSFIVTDARVTKVTPYVRLDYSGHWWDPNDPGWGLFIWQDAASATDSLLAAWFTYGTDGKPTWYTTQPRWDTSTRTLTGDLYAASRMPGPTVPPPNPTTATIAGTARLDFTDLVTENGTVVRRSIDQGSFIYSIGNGPTLTRTIQRFRP